MSENLTKREVAFFATKLQNGKNTPVLALFIPDTYDHGTVVTDVFDPNFTKIDNWAKTINEKLETTTTPQGDYGIGSLKVVLRSLKDFQGNIRAVFCSSNNPTEPYVVEKEIDSTITTNIDIAIPNEVLQGFGKVFCRLVLRSSDRGKIVGSIQEVYFHVVEKKDWEFLEPLLPSDEKEYVKDIVDELYEILKNSKNELKEYNIINF